MKFSLAAVVLATAAGLVLSGCATSSIQSRRQERSGAYEQMTPEMRALVDQGQIKVGMDSDAVYIAWGKPSEILQGESPAGAATTWLYHGSTLEEVRYWSHHPVRYRQGYYAQPALERDYTLRDYIRAEVVFEGGVVKEWRSLPEPLR